jgi:rhodanese-related sulfurtransferase
MHPYSDEAEISVREAAELLRKNPNAKLVDVRTDEEYSLAKIPGAVLINNYEKLETLKGWPRDTTLVVHCHHGIRSLDAAATFRDLGFTDVKSLRGGIEAWSAEVDPSIPRY